MEVEEVEESNRATRGRKGETFSLPAVPVPVPITVPVPLPLPGPYRAHSTRRFVAAVAFSELLALVVLHGLLLPAKPQLGVHTLFVRLACGEVDEGVHGVRVGLLSVQALWLCIQEGISQKNA